MTFLAACCGIAGRAPRDLCDAMLSAQGAGAGRDLWTGEAAGLAAAAVPRLSGGDTAALAETPCGRWIIAADARLDAREALAERLGLDRSVARSSLGLLVAAWSRWGAETPDRLSGDFAILAWDRQRGELVLARDPLGQRPLFFRPIGGGVAVASMPAGLTAPVGAGAEPDLERLAHVVTGRLYRGNGSFHRGIERVGPGETVRLRPDGAAGRTRYWQPRLDPDFARTTARSAEVLGGLLDQAAAARLRDVDGQVAVHLSAGLDSSAGAASAVRALGDPARVLAATAIPDPASPCFAPPGRIADEGPLAAATAQSLGIPHVAVAAGRGYVEWLDDAFAALPQPLPNPFNFGWSAAIFDTVRAGGIDVLLTGQSGNLTFSMGVPWGWRPALRAGEWREAARLLPGPMRIAARLRGGRRPGATLLRPGLLPPDEPRGTPAEAALAMLRAMDPGPLLRGFHALWGVDMRDPTADRALAEYALRVPAAALRDGGLDRAPARLALAGRVPDAVRLERARGYQAADWLAQATHALPLLRTEVQALARSPIVGALIDVAAVQRLLDRWPTVRRFDADVERVYRYRLPQAVAAAGWAARLAGER